MFYYEIDFADFQSSTVITQKIEGKLEKLEKHFDRITSAHVTVRLPHRHRNKHIYHIQVQVDIPGYTFIVNREPEMNYAHSDINVAIRDAFDKVKRKLDDFIEDRRERPHPVSGSQHGYVISYDPGNGFGFVAAEDGREIYFNSSSLVEGNPSQIKAGVEVRLSTEEGEEGPQISSLHIVGGHHRALLEEGSLKSG